MARRVLIAGLVLSLILAGISAYQWQRAERRVRETTNWARFVMDSLGTSLRLPPPPEGTPRDSVYWQWIATSAQIQSRRWALAVSHWAKNHSILLEDHEVAQLREEGLTDPVRQLRESLFNHPELITNSGIHGGTMRFAPGDHIVLLYRPYVFARYDDGHIGGVMLLEYAIDPGGRITWKRLWHELE